MVCIANAVVLLSISSVACTPPVTYAMAAVSFLVAVACGTDEGLKLRITYRVTLAVVTIFYVNANVLYKIYPMYSEIRKFCVS